MKEATIDLHARPLEFFHKEVQTSLQNQKLQLTQESEYYLVNLLAEQAQPTAKRQDGFDFKEALERPLVLWLKEAYEAEPSRRLGLLKAIGDSSLFISGFFQEFFHSKSFSRDYYCELGSRSYEMASQSLQERLFKNSSLISMFESLATDFEKLSEVISDLADRIGTDNYQDLYAVHRRWQTNGSKQLLKVLKREGVRPLKPPQLKD